MIPLPFLKYHRLLLHRLHMGLINRVDFLELMQLVPLLEHGAIRANRLLAVLAVVLHFGVVLWAHLANLLFLLGFERFHVVDSLRRVKES